MVFELQSVRVNQKQGVRLTRLHQGEAVHITRIDNLHAAHKHKKQTRALHT